MSMPPRNAVRHTLVHNIEEMAERLRFDIQHYQERLETLEKRRQHYTRAYDEKLATKPDEQESLQLRLAYDVGAMHGEWRELTARQGLARSYLQAITREVW